MELEYLNEFTVIARLESFSRAAEELCMSQSSLSKHILALERELGVPLLQRSSRRVTLTSAGARILPLASEIGRLNLSIRSLAAQQADREKRVLSVASIPVMAHYNITGLLAGFRRDFPQIQLEITECERQDLGELLESGKCELAFARSGLEQEEGYTSLALCRDTLVAVVAEGHPLAEREEIALSELKDEPLLFLDQQTGFHHLYSALCRQAGFVPQIAYTGRRPENIMELAAQGMGVALVMKGHADYYSPEHVKTLALSPVTESAICLIGRKGVVRSRQAQMFWDYVQEHRQI